MGDDGLRRGRWVVMSSKSWQGCLVACIRYVEVEVERRVARRTRGIWATEEGKARLGGLEKSRKK